MPLFEEKLNIGITTYKSHIFFIQKKNRKKIADNIPFWGIFFRLGEDNYLKFVFITYFLFLFLLLGITKI